MSSQDTLNSARSEEEEAKIYQREIEKEQANVKAMQHAIDNEDEPDVIESLRRDIESKNRVIASLEQKYEMRTKDAERLRRQVAEEQQRERQQEQLRQEQENDSLAKKTAKEAVRRGLFGL